MNFTSFHSLHFPGKKQTACEGSLVQDLQLPIPQRQREVTRVLFAVII